MCGNRSSVDRGNLDDIRRLIWDARLRRRWIQKTEDCATGGFGTLKIAMMGQWKQGHTTKQGAYHYWWIGWFRAALLDSGVPCLESPVGDLHWNGSRGCTEYELYVEHSDPTCTEFAIGEEVWRHNPRVINFHVVAIHMYCTLEYLQYSCPDWLPGGWGIMHTVCLLLGLIPILFKLSNCSRSRFLPEHREIQQIRPSSLKNA